MAKVQCTFVSSWSNGLDIKSKAMVCLETGEVTDIEISDTLPDDDATLIEEYIEIANSTFKVVDVNEENVYYVLGVDVLQQATANLGTEKAHFIVPRDSHSETTFAVVEAKVQKGLSSEGAFLKALDSALTTWFKTDTGKVAWEGTRGDFNVGDLPKYQSDETLINCLAEQGIVELAIDTFSSDNRMNWNYDRVLGGE